MSNPTLERSTGARILVLDDEPVQRMTVHLQLAGLGTFIDFGDPRAAIEYLDANEIDAAVVDVRMPHLPVDGKWFLQELRERDRDVGVVLRTADDSVEVADAGIESRAVQRVIKSSPDAKARLRTAVQQAIDETRERRRLSAAFRDAQATRTQLATVLGKIESDVSVAETVRGFIQSLTNQVATIAGYAELLADEFPNIDPARRGLLERNRAAAQQLSDRINAFLGTSYLTAQSARSANACIDGLRQLFSVHRLFHDRGMRLEAKGILPDVMFCANPLQLASALRHLIEYCAMRAARKTAISVSVSRCTSPQATIAQNKDGLLLNGRSLPTGECVIISVRGEIGEIALPTLREDFQNCPSDPKIGNLLVVSAELVDDRLALEVTRSRKGVTTFSIYLPAAE
jgi:CheY-like chemotaxis protein